MKRLIFLLPVSVAILLLNTNSVLALQSYRNPVKEAGVYRSANLQEPGFITHHSTSVTLMWDTASSGSTSDISISDPTIVPGACYLLGRGFDRNKKKEIVVDKDNDEGKILSSDPWYQANKPMWPENELPEDEDHSDEDVESAYANTYKLGRPKDGNWVEPFWVQTTENLIPKYGWTKHDYARQSGGNLCGFNEDPIRGTGSDTIADYVRADSDGRLWFHNLCENFEGVRQDCNEEYYLGKIHQHALFRVYCGYYDPNREGQYKEDIEKGFIASNGLPPNYKRGSYQMTMDPMCKSGLANINAQGGKELQIFELAVYPKTRGDGVQQQELWVGAFEMVTDPLSPYAINGAFAVQSDFVPIDFNIESKTVSSEFGDIPRDPTELASVILKFAIGIAGGIAFLLMVFGSFRLIFSRGDPEQVQQGRDILTAAIVGLLVIIFATFILQLVGISILGLGI